MAKCARCMTKNEIENTSCKTHLNMPIRPYIRTSKHGRGEGGRFELNKQIVVKLDHQCS
jgi:hypothetical protein